MPESSTLTTLPRIQRFESLGLGLFLHWGLYSLHGQGEWTYHIARWERADYMRLTESFTAQEFDADAIARFARDNGFGYITLTTRHHDGFSLYDTRGLSDFDSLHATAGRDLVAEFTKACHDHGILPFFYHTTMDWMWKNRETEFLQAGEFSEYLQYLRDSIEILCTHYGPIGGFWFDGNWCRPNDDWEEDELYGLIRKHQPEAMIINNTGLFAPGQSGHPEIDSLTYEQGLPSPPDRSTWTKVLAGEMCQTLNHHWGWSFRDFHYLSLPELIRNFCGCRKVGMNYLINVGPTGAGALPELETALLRRFGEWMNIHGRALVDATPLSLNSDREGVFAMVRGQNIFLAVNGLGVHGNEAVTVGGGQAESLTLKGLPGPIVRAEWIDNGEPLEISMREADAVSLKLTPFPYGQNHIIRVASLEYTSS